MANIASRSIYNKLIRIDCKIPGRGQRHADAEVVIGAGVGSSNVTLAGDFIFAIALILGGLSMNEENMGLRITLVAIGGLFVIGAFASSLGLSSLLSRF